MRIALCQTDSFRCAVTEDESCIKNGIEEYKKIFSSRLQHVYTAVFILECPKAYTYPELFTAVP